MTSTKIRDYRDLAVYHETLRLRASIRETLGNTGICKSDDQARSRLRELGEILPRTIVSGWINEECRGTEFTIKTAYKEVHAIEALLFQLLLEKMIAYDAAAQCADRIQVIKRFLAAHLEQLRNGASL